MRQCLTELLEHVSETHFYLLISVTAMLLHLQLSFRMLKMRSWAGLNC